MSYLYRRGEKRRWVGDRDGFGDGERRRSPRLSGFVSVSSHPSQNIGDCNNQTNNNSDARTITSPKDKTSPPKHPHHLQPSCDPNNQNGNDKLVPHSRSCAELQPKESLKQDDGPLKHHDDHSNNDESWLPEKSSLELLLDALQKRDTYDIFAEPVDPNEVEEYYEIIKEPMDFGTMRAKLHEGMYKNIQQFERDVYLIFGNAMHFNSSATVYFRQARALEDLAKKLFLVLKTDPENFKQEFTAIRRRSSRRFDGEHRGLNIGSCRKLARDTGSSGKRIDLGGKDFGRQKNCMTVVDRRSTYNPWIYLLDEASPAASPISCGTKSLILATQEEIGYKESLMLFVKDLGPTSHKVAKKKLQGLWMQTSSTSRRHSMNGWDNSSTRNCNGQAPAASSFGQREPNNFLFCGTIPTASNASHHLNDSETANDIRTTKYASKNIDNLTKCFLDTNFVIPCTSLGASGRAFKDQVHGKLENWISTADQASDDKLHQNICLSQYGEDVNVIAHAGSKENEKTEWTTPTVLLKDGGMLSYHVNSVKKLQAGSNFDFNRVQAILSSSCLVRCSSRDNKLKNHEVTPSSGFVGVTEFNRVYPEVTSKNNTLQPSSVSSQIYF